MIADLKPDESAAIQQNSDDVNLRIPYDINSASNSYYSRICNQKSNSQYYDNQ